MSRSTLADANERRDWRLYAAFAAQLIVTARKLYQQQRDSQSWLFRSGENDEEQGS